MARKERNDVDYFPHSVNHGKKMFYIRSKFGNDGYAVWFMLLEHLGKASYHYLNLSDDVEIMYLSSEFQVSETVLKEVINSLVKLGEFDKYLWDEGSILFNEKFAENISDAYRKRSNKCIDKNSLLSLLVAKGSIKQPKLHPKQPKLHPKGGEKPQSKVKYSKVKESIEEIYNAYPSRCVVKSSNTGKGTKDKDKIESLLGEYSKEHLLKVIKFYIDECKKSNTYMKNFKTFLNNLPDLPTEKEIKKEEDRAFNLNDYDIPHGAKFGYNENKLKELCLNGTYSKIQIV